MVDLRCLGFCSSTYLRKLLSKHVSRECLATHFVGVNKIEEHRAALSILLFSDGSFLKTGDPSQASCHPTDLMPNVAIVAMIPGFAFD